MTRTGGETPTFDLVALQTRLRDLTGVDHDLRGCRRAGTGHVNTTWLLDANPMDLVVKVQSTPSVVFQAAPEIEPRVLRGLAATTVPVPQVLATDPAGTVIGTPWFAMELVHGTGLPDEPSTGYAERGWFADADPDRRTAVWNGFVDLLADLHRLPADTFGPAPRGGNHSAMLAFWVASLHDTVSPGAAKVQERALRWLQDNAPDDADTACGPCMGDARLANAIVDGDTIVALVDWELAHVGNPRGDLAYKLYLDDRYARIAGGRPTGLPTAEQTWRRWAQRTGFTIGDTRYWELFAATFMAVTSTRAFRLLRGTAEAEVESIHPSLVDLERLLSEVS
ncbi:phosphotransferase family protein [Frankia sp. R82]|uniref:phosphotransferase family protein n=1 Tax=Frankia sp. R82 TaxID=2950553 RepID=UPI002044AC9F|nr:phosphotransferase family protein [Frankia sp. R82]MCM3882158.1 phosphotransferase family protein [Frankia sp. R82]